MMRREGFELMVGRPEIVTKTVDGKVLEPVEHLTIDVPDNFVGTVIERLGPRRGEMVKMHNHGYGRVRLEFRVPSRGLIGLRSEMLTETRGTIVMNSLFDGYMPYQGEIPQRPSGALISDRNGATTAYALNGLQDRGVLFLTAGVEVYEGMVIGEHSRDNDLDVNVVREKKLTNMRASSADDAIRLVPFKPMNLEQAIEFIAEDELVEVTPKSLRLRKKILAGQSPSPPQPNPSVKRSHREVLGGAIVALILVAGVAWYAGVRHNQPAPQAAAAVTSQAAQTTDGTDELIPNADVCSQPHAEKRTGLPHLRSLAQRRDGTDEKERQSVFRRSGVVRA